MKEDVGMAQTRFAPIAINVEDLWVMKGGGVFSAPKAIVQGASFTVDAGHFVAVIGPNGAGKTTLFKSLIGEKPSAGRIKLYRDNGSQADFENFYDNPEYWMQQIGYIPVDNVLHEELTVRQALMNVGRLRLPQLDDAQIFLKIQNTIERLGFGRDDYRLDQYIGTLSSGERKKMNIAAELLTDPPLLLLDEPTSNLDPNAERDLMDSLRTLAGINNEGQGPTVLLITHTLATLDRCDNVIYIENSRLAAEGNEEAIFTDLEAQALKEAQQAGEDYYIPRDEEQRFEHWAFIFDVFKTDEERAARTRHRPPEQPARERDKRRDMTEDSFLRQFRILSQRYFLLRLNDLNGIFAIMFAAFVAGFLLLIAPSEVFLEADDATAARQTVVLYAILVVITGAFNSHREISKEFRIYLHERTKGLKPLAYIMSKTVWLSVVVGVFGTTIIMALTGTPLARLLVIVIAVIIAAIGLWHTYLSNARLALSQRDKLLRTLRIGFVVSPLLLAFVVQLQNKTLPDFPIHPTTVEIVMWLTLILAAIAATTSGLMLSASVGANNDRATQLVIGLIIFNVILAFSVLVASAPEFEGLFNALEPFSASYWGYGGASSVLSIYCWAGRPVIENFNSSGHILSTWLWLIAHIVGTLGLGVIFLRLKETWTSQTRTVTNMVTPTREAINFATIALLVALIGWGVFLKDTSQQYFSLTYFDRFFGANRYAQLENLPEDATLTPLQQAFGSISASPCRLREDEDPEATAQAAFSLRVDASEIVSAALAHSPDPLTFGGH